MNLLERTNLTGAITALIFYGVSILVFALRLAGRPQTGHWLGIVQLLLAIPLLYLLIRAPGLQRSTLYYIQIALLLLWLAAEGVLDYLLRYDFRQVRWMVIVYVTLFFAAGGGMLGVAAQAGRIYLYISVPLFLVMAVLAFVQRAVTGQ